MLDGFLLLNKPQGITSFLCVNKIKKTFKLKKVGHCGTLDPIATGLLILVIGKATKQSSLIMSLEKAYNTSLFLGEERDTQDATGKVIEKISYSKELNEIVIEKAFKKFLGKQWQIPPMYSAKKKNGKKFYELARKGIEFQREAREIEVKSIKINSISLPYIKFFAVVSKGTYMRTLCSDIGKKLGSCAYMANLTRTKIGKFSLNNAISLNECLTLSYENFSKRIIPLF